MKVASKPKLLTKKNINFNVNYSQFYILITLIFGLKVFKFK